MKIEIGRKYASTEPFVNIKIDGDVVEWKYPVGSEVVITRYIVYPERSIVWAKFPTGDDWVFAEKNFRRWFKEVE